MLIGENVPIFAATVNTTVKGKYEKFGVPWFTIKVNAVVPVPPEFVAWIVKTVDVNNAVGVPLIVPVVLSKFSPAGNAGDMV